MKERKKGEVREMSIKQHPSPLITSTKESVFLLEETKGILSRIK